MCTFPNQEKTVKPPLMILAIVVAAVLGMLSLTGEGVSPNPCPPMKLPQLSEWQRLRALAYANVIGVRPIAAGTTTLDEKEREWVAFVGIGKKWLVTFEIQDWGALPIFASGGNDCQRAAEAVENLKNAVGINLRR